MSPSRIATLRGGKIDEPLRIATLRGGKIDDGQGTQLSRSLWIGLSVAAVGVAVAAMALCPSHDSFEEFLTAAARARGSLLERFTAAIAAETHSWVLFRTGSHRGRHFVGVLGAWLSLPSSLVQRRVAPHELYAVLCVGIFLVGRLAPAFIGAHGLCSLHHVRAGRLWVLLTSQLVHQEPVSLMSATLLPLLSFGPIVQSALGSKRSALLLLGAALAASATSLLWQAACQAVRGKEAHDASAGGGSAGGGSAGGGSAGGGSVGGGSVAMGVIAANAALHPDSLCDLFGMVKLTAGQLLVLFFVVDAVFGGVDLAAHMGGAGAGYALAQRWGRSPWRSNL